MASNWNFVTIVSGLPRSGTSMMMRMLDRGGMPAVTDNVRTADVDNPLGYYEFERVKKIKDDAAWVPEAVGKAVKMVYSLLYHMPPAYQYRVLFMRRKLDEVLASQRKMLNRLGKAGASTSDEKTAQLFRMQLDKFSAWVKEQPNFALLDTDYGQMIENPRPQLEAINQFLGGGLDVEAMCRVVDPSLYRNRAAEA
jgi:hypothetical protein